MGPAAPVINRIRNMYLMEILIKLAKDADLFQQKKKVISNTILDLFACGKKDFEV